MSKQKMVVLTMIFAKCKYQWKNISNFVKRFSVLKESQINNITSEKYQLE